MDVRSPLRRRSARVDPDPTTCTLSAKLRLRLRLRYAKCHVYRPQVSTYVDLSANFCDRVEIYDMHDPSSRRSQVSGAIRKSRCPARRATCLRFSLWSPLYVMVVRPRKHVGTYGKTTASESLHTPHRTRRADPEHACARSSRVDALRERDRSTRRVTTLLHRRFISCVFASVFAALPGARARTLVPFHSRVPSGMTLQLRR